MEAATALVGASAVVRRAALPPLLRPFQPVVAEEFARMRRSNRAIPAGEVVGGTVLVAAPADPLGMGRTEWELRHFAAPIMAASAGCVLARAQLGHTGTFFGPFRVRCVRMKAVTADAASPRAWQTSTFGALALGLGTVSWIVVHGSLAPHTRHVMTMALSFDLLITLPGSYYLLVARPRGQRWWAVLAVAALGLLRSAMLIAPAAIACLLLGAAIEAGLLGVLVVRGRAAWRERGRHDDALVVLGRIMPQSSMPLAAEIAGSELAVFYYSLLSWRRRPHVADGMRPFSVHQRGGVTAILYVMAVMCVLDTAILHIVVQHWSTRVAWALTAFDLYGALWLVAAARALVLRPILVDADTIVFRASLWWTLTVDRTNVADVRPFSGRVKRGSTDPLSLAWFARPSVLVRFHEPVVAAGLWGRKKSAASLAVAVDDVEGFVRAVRDL